MSVRIATWAYDIDTPGIENRIIIAIFIKAFIQYYSNVFKYDYAKKL